MTHKGWDVIKKEFKQTKIRIFADLYYRISIYWSWYINNQRRLSIDATIVQADLCILTLVMLNKLICHTHFQFLANQTTWSRLLIQIHILNGKQCRSRSVGFSRSQLIWIYTVCKGRVYLGSAGQGLNLHMVWGPFSCITHYVNRDN